MAYGNENTQNQGPTSEGNLSGSNSLVTPSSNLDAFGAQDQLALSTSNNNFPLLKKVISNKRAQEILSGDFKEVIISEEKYDSEKIKEIYNDLFYQIPKKGKKSHYSIIEQSTDYVYPEINENLEDAIHSLSENIVELNESASILKAPLVIPQHPIYDNGLIIQEGDPIDNKPVEPGSTRWYMQQGMKRAITLNYEGYYTRVLREANNEKVYNGNGEYIPTDLSPNFRYLTPEDLNGIQDGEPIAVPSDFNKIKIKPIEQQYIYSDMDVELTCEGVEKFYKFKYGELGYDADLSDYEHNGRIGGYWWLDTEAYCKIKYQTDIDPTTTFKPKTHNLTWKGTKTISPSRDAKFYGHTINGTTDPLDVEFYGGNHSQKEVRSVGYNANIPVGVWKKWGEDGIFPSVLSATGRINYRIKSPFNSSGNVVDGDGMSHKFYNIIDGTNEAPTQGYDDQANLLDSYYNQLSTKGTRMINNACYGPIGENCYGDFGQFVNTGTAHGGVHNLFQNPNNSYYLDNINGRKHKETDKLLGITVHTHTVKGRVYGQPIIKVDGRYCVFLESYRVRYLSTFYGDLHRDYNVFMRLDNGSIFKIQNKDLEERVTGYKRYHNDLFNWMAKEGSSKLNNPSIVWPGLKGYRINYQNTDLDSNPQTKLIIEVLKAYFGDIVQNILSSISGITGNYGFSFNFDGEQLKDNPFNPKNGGSNYAWRLKNITKTTS